ncbi:uncharacterized protein LOC143860202 [Tasmannia lanceolata]|uniref:uncharacterized protein LOC143860202 n=1 Tax=Tasmannia lanceolata TaxID=3420 RepID=UPI004063241C
MAITNLLPKDLEELERSSASSFGREMVNLAKKLTDICVVSSTRIDGYHSLYTRANNEKRVIEDKMNVGADLLSSARANLQKADFLKAQADFLKEQKARADAVKKLEEAIKAKADLRAQVVAEFKESEEFQELVAYHLLGYKAEGFIQCRDQVKELDAKFPIEKLKGPSGTDLSEEESDTTDLPEDGTPVKDA